MDEVEPDGDATMLLEEDDNSSSATNAGATPPDDDLGASSRRKHLIKSRKSTARRRRRSSARFLRLGDIQEHGDDGDLNNAAAATNKANLGELYQNVIRMNAENKINASNSWSLSLIDHMDSFLKVDTPTKIKAGQRVSMGGTLTPSEDLVNFTKASCTLDASVKIYSYRVDDVHLTSYKVLANLNRTETGKNHNSLATTTSSDGGHGGDIIEGDDGNEGSSKKSGSDRKATNTETLALNTANINMQKLDSAFDIDPLFHKMSKSFDEGGAKGLLLANLAVGPKGCNIVFDSTLDEINEEKATDEDGITNAESAAQDCSTIDVSSFIVRLQSQLDGQHLNAQPLVPQLAGLRDDFYQLQEGGFVDPTIQHDRYASSQEEENEADKSIHQEAFERSRVSAADLGRSLMEDEDDSAGGFPMDSYGSGDEHDNNDGDGYDFGGAGIGDGMFTSFVTGDEHRFSSGSFQAAPSEPEPSQATVLLDAIVAGDISTMQSNYEYFNSQALDQLQQSNAWAGSMHWKKGSSRRKQKAPKDKSQDPKSKKKKTRAKRTSREVLIDLSNKPVENLDDLLRQPPKSKRGVDPLQLSKAMKSKHSKVDNLLPLYVDVGLQELTSLFMRPNSTLEDMNRNANTNTALTKKSVGFGGVETMGWNDDADGGNEWDDGNGDDNDGPGFDFAGGNDDSGDEFMVQELEGVRKVEKVRVGHATVAKKVDVRKLKSDLWEELEATLRHKKDKDGITDPSAHVEDGDERQDEGENEDDDQECAVGTNEPKKDSGGDNASNRKLSFYDTVQEMQTSQSQTDITLPFYFICVLHLANEKGLALDSTGLEDFLIRSD